MIYIWLDESDKYGTYYSNFYGGILVQSQHKNEVLRRMEAIRDELGIMDEIKWQKVNVYHFDKYVRLMDELFDMGKEGLDQEGIRLYLDEIPLNQNDKINFVKHLYGLNNDADFKAKGIKFVEKGISEVDSKVHLPLQFMDVVLGAICFKLNEKDKLKSDGDERPGRRTILKLKLYKHINAKIRELYPDFNIGISTPLKNDSDRWFQIYRHWSFKPKHHTRNITRTKRAKK